MIDIDKNIISQRPVEEVFNYMSNLARSAEWQNGLTEVHQIAGQSLGVGSKYAFIRTFPGRKMAASNKITQFTPNVIAAFKTISGSMPLEVSNQCKTAGKGMKLTSKIEMEPRGFIILAQTLISSSLQRDGKAKLLWL